MSSSSLLFTCLIDNFYPPLDRVSEGQQDVLGTKKFEMLLGDKKIKWEMTIELAYKGITFYFKNEISNFKDYNVRITCMIPRIDEDEDKFDTEGNMYTKHITGSASSYKSLCMKFRKFADYDGYYLDDATLEMYIKIEMMEENFPKECNTQKTDYVMPPSFADLFRSGDLSDLKVVCADGVEIPVHRCILYANSPVFKAMMMTDLKETIRMKFRAPDINQAVMNKILQFMYTQKIDIADHLHGILYGAEKYQMEYLKSLCINYISENLCAANAVEYFLLTSLYDLERLRNLCLTYIQLNFENLRSTEKWKQLNAEQLEMIEKAVKDYKASKLTFEFYMDPYLWGYDF